MQKPRKVLTVFGTRPEAIKLAPVIRELEGRRDRFRVVNVSSGQHEELLETPVRLFEIQAHHDLGVMVPKQTPSGVCGRILQALDGVLELEGPDVVLVQGDTTTALAGALAGFHRGIRVGHVEAGLRSGDARNPFPEEMNRRLITQLASLHFAPTEGNRRRLLEEGAPAGSIHVTGNPVVDALDRMLREAAPGPELAGILEACRGSRLLVVTTHRRESFGAPLARCFAALEDFVDRHADVMLLFPVPPNPSVREMALEHLSGHPRILLSEPLRYTDFLVLLKHAWLVASDSGGVQEEVASLRKPLLILRENTERPEALDAGYARLVGSEPGRLGVLLEEAYQDDLWAKRVRHVRNPFGRVGAARRIADALEASLEAGHEPAAGTRRETA